MSTLDDLKARARPNPVSTSYGDLQVTIERARGADLVIDALTAYFGSDDTRQEVHVIVDGDVVGYVSREDAYELVDLKPRGSGLPGNPTLPDEP